jgi:predicted peptidase
MIQRLGTVLLPCLLSWSLASASLAAEPSAAKLVRQTYTGAFGERDYFVYLPARYDSEPGRRWPLMMFLHGDGERGDAKKDLDWVLGHGPVYEAWIYKRDLPFVIVSPQLPLFGREKTVPYIRDRDPATLPRRQEDGVPPRPDEFPTPEPMDGAPAEAELPVGPEGPPDGWYRLEEDLLKIVDQALAEYRTDPRRVYLTGLSYGGFGTWYLASRHPERFAAIAPVVGWGHPELMKPLAERGMPVWTFAGGRDPVVRVKHFFPGLNKLEELGHDDVRFTVHEDRGHDVWRRIYAGQDLYDWLLSKRLE